LQEKLSAPRKKADRRPDAQKLDRVIAQSLHGRDQRMQNYREQALKVLPWICGRCGREFSHDNLQELTVHHKDHDHDNNPPDGSNWELLCRYCHDNEHSRHLDAFAGGTAAAGPPDASATYKPFANLKALLDKSKK
jgi:5-methylcytosine-specific restriction endonuclease McrA